MHWIRVYSGSLKPNSRVLNPGKDKKENVAAALAHSGHETRGADRQACKPATSSASSACGNSITGDTLCDPKQPILLETIQFPETVISLAIEPESTAERKKLGEVLEMMKRQDPDVPRRTRTKKPARR